MTPAAALFWVSVVATFSPAQQSPYAGMENREIKALSSQQIESLRAGQGMGLAMAAELNDFPGPKHVLEMGEHLNLDGEQVAHTEVIFQEMAQEAKRLGGRILEVERRLDRAFADRSIDEKSLEKMVSEIAQLSGALRNVHLRAHIRMTQVLSQDQVKRYKVLRGYHGRHGHPPG